jgi:hypothetical protein
MPGRTLSLHRRRDDRLDELTPDPADQELEFWRKAALALAGVQGHAVVGAKMGEGIATAEGRVIPWMDLPPGTLMIVTNVLQAVETLADR